ncbi:hypothetical protein D3C76_1398340 [compost metagenome]
MSKASPPMQPQAEPGSVKPKRKRTPRAKSRVLSAVEFDALRPFLKNMAENRIEAARLVLVDQAKYEDAAAACGLASPQAVTICIKSVWAYHERLQEAQQALADKG